VFCAAGPVKHEDFVALVEQKYGQMPARKFTPLPAPVFQGGASFVELKGANLCNVIFATESVSNTDPDNLAYMVLGGILSGGTSSRLHKEVVVRKELAAGVEASVDSYKNGGMFYIQAGMEAQKVKPFIDAVYKEIRALADNLTQDELDKVKIQMEMGLLSSMESNQAVCNSYAVRAQATGKLVTQADVLAQVQKLTVDDIKRVARKVLASQPAMAGAVPAGTDVNLLPRSEDLIALRDGKKPQDEAARPATRKKSL